MKRLDSYSTFAHTFKPNLPKNVLYILSTLQSSGFEAYLVGGCVRDMLMCELGRQRDISDYDIATSATPQETMTLFTHCIPTGLKYGTVTVIIESQHYEVTTFRVDGIYTNARHPDSVCFSQSLTEDVSRRDFTINALAYEPHLGLIDTVGGLADMMHKRIVCVGNPNTRFSEDGLRILRALRFSATLGFSIESRTKTAMHSLASLLKNIARERIRVEMTKLLHARWAYQVLCEYSDIFYVIFPYPQSKCDFSIFTSLYLYEDCSDVIAWACFLYPYGAYAEQILANLAFDNATKKAICTLLAHYDIALDMSIKDLRLLLVVLGGRDNGQNISGERVIKDILVIKKAQKADSKQLDIFENRFYAILHSRLPLSLKELCINGDDLIDIGAKGRQIGEILRTLLYLVLDEALAHTKVALLSKARTLAINIDK